MKKLLLLLFLFVTSHAHAQWLYRDLNPSSSLESMVLGVSATDQVGWIYGGTRRWFSSPTSFVDLGGPYARALATDGNLQAGYDGKYAMRWSGSASTGVKLRMPSTATSAVATSIYGQALGGYTTVQTTRSAGGVRATYWPSVTSNPVLLPMPTDANHSYVYAIGPQVEGGAVTYELNGIHQPRAATWHGSTHQFVDRHPVDFQISKITGISNFLAGGWVSENEDPVNGTAHAALWDLRYENFYDLHDFSYASSAIQAISGYTAVGSVETFGQLIHAAVFNVTSGTIIDLHQFLPAGIYLGSEAFAVWESPTGCGTQVGGYAMTNSGWVHAMLWYIPWC